MDKEKQIQLEEAAKLLGRKHPELVKQYQSVFLKSANGRAILKDILSDTLVFEAKLKPEDLALRNYGIKLLYTIAGAHVTPGKLDLLFSTFIDALADHERATTPID